VEGAGVAIGRSSSSPMRSATTSYPCARNRSDMLSTKVTLHVWSPDLIGDRNTQVLVNWLAQAAEETSVVCQTASPRDLRANETVRP